VLAAISHTGINITNTVVTVREYLLNLHSHHIIVAKIDLRLYSAASDGGFRQSKLVLLSLMPSKICVFTVTVMEFLLTQSYKIINNLTIVIIWHDWK